MAREARTEREPLREALEWYRDALHRDRGSWTAATGVARLAQELGDTEAALAAAEALAELSDDPKARARFWLDASELLLGPHEDPRLGTRPERRGRAVTLLERALDADPDSVPVAGRLATTLLDQHQGERLVTAFRAALGRARSADAVVMFGSEIARVARTELQDLPLAIDAMRRVRAVAPQHIPSLLTLAELSIAARVWPDAVEALEAVVATSREAPPKLTALFALASIYEKVLARPAEVDRVLRAALAIAPTNVRALRALLRRLTAEPTDLDDATARARRREVAVLLDRLAEAETDLDARSRILIELSEVHAHLGDARAAERALVMAVATAPGSTRAFARLTSFFRSPGGVDTAGYARALGAAIGLGDQFGRTDARWLAALGQLEVGPLQRAADGIGHLQRAVGLDPSLYETRLDLARVLAQKERHGDAAGVLLGMIDPSPRPLLSIPASAGALGLLEHALEADRRAEEAIVAAELRAIAGDLDDSRTAWLRSRRLPAVEAHYGALDRPTLVTHVLPQAGRHVLLEVAAAIAGVEAKILRSDLGSVGIGPRDRVLSRSGHPTRLMLDRLARQLGVGDVELAIAPKATRVRVLTHDAPWVVVPASLAELPESTQLVALARALARVALGVPWLEELEPERMLGLLVAAARHVAPNYGRSAGATVPFDGTLGRALTRRQRRLLEELAPHLGSGPPRAPSPADFHGALLQAELRAAYVLTGDLLAVVDESALRDATFADRIREPGEGALAGVLDHPRIGDVARFALTPDATALRRRVSSTWTR
jgi:tetratricopeptide (TPR) repeat protein